MRFSSAITPQPLTPPPPAGDALPGDENAPRTIATVAATAAAPWPADSPPDDLDQRVRLVGEWGDW